MGFLKRVLKISDEDQDEGEDEFHAEQNGLLMVSSLPSDALPPAAEPDSESPPPPAEAEPVADPDVQVAQGEGDPLDVAAESPPAESQVQQDVPTQAPPGEGAGDPDALSLFKASAKEGVTGIPSVVKEDMEDISTADLLADARSVRARLLGAEAGGGGE
jgi:hypothetical protein